VNPPPFSASSGDGGGTPPDSPHLVPDWQEALVEAIQQRDAPRAMQLAERCVHRYGMHTLESVMDRAEGLGGDAEAVRSWLLPLLAQPAVMPLPPSLASPSPLPPAPVGLDEAFAPLEVAFPPLTPPLGDPRPNDGLIQPLPDPPSLPGTTFVEPFPNEAMEERAAAPVPTFEVKGLSSGSIPPPRRSRNDDRRDHVSPAPISPALEPWLVWLPGAVQSRPRS
jgi:hypothetical protein